ncbi:hypothetical protein Bra471DRAFT_01718 [Bradyrhizobium sp. WSM471]|nr:hypothetical protein Bra471DRAFT_01718 [Bradyrhizobium sp. WSM471]
MFDPRGRRRSNSDKLSPVARMDNGYYDWSPIPAGLASNGQGVAVCFMLHFEHFNWYPRPDVVVPPSFAAEATPYPRIPDVHSTSAYEYGNRVGGFRVLDVLRRNGVRPTIAMDLDVARRADRWWTNAWRVKRNSSGMASPVKCSSMSHVRGGGTRVHQSTIKRPAETVGQTVLGWKGSECGESSRTVRLLAAYVKTAQATRA